MKHLKDATDIKCECGCLNFKEVVRFKKISKILIGDTKDAIVPIPFMVCDACSKELEEMSPKF